MDLAKKILSKVPKPVLVGVVLVAGAIGAILFNPPQDYCDAQLGVFLNSQKGYLSSMKEGVGSYWTRSTKYCIQNKNEGSCAEFFKTVQKALKDFRIAPSECAPKLISNELIQKTFMESLKLMTELGWGLKAPELSDSMYSWLGVSEISTFCHIKNILEQNLESEEWESFVRRIIVKLPHASELSFNEAYHRTLFSVRCEGLP